MIANVSPASCAFSETLSSLKFAQRAKLIKNKASINQESSGSSEGLRKEILRLKDELTNAKNLITTLENGEWTRSRQQIASQSLSGGVSNELEGFPADETLALRNTNQHQLQLELLLRESLNVIYETEKHLQEEIERKDEFLGMFENLCDLHKDNDSKLKTLLTHYEQKVSIESITSDHDKYNALLQENTILREIAQNAPLIMQVFEENLKLKEKIREFEVDDLHSAEYNIREKVELNMLFLTEVASKLEESIRSRQVLDQRLENMAYLSGLSPQDLSKPLSQINEVQELITKLETQNYEILKLKQQKETSENTIASLLSDINRQSENMKLLEEDKQHTIANYEHRIKEIKERLDTITPSATAALERDLLESRDRLEVQQKLLEDVENQSRYKENQLITANKQKDEQLAESLSIIHSLQHEVTTLRSRLSSFEEKNRHTTEEMGLFASEKKSLKDKVAELISTNKSLEGNLNSMLLEKLDLQHQLSELKERANSSTELEDAQRVIRKLEISLQRELLEKGKIQDELETIQESYSFVLNEMASLQKDHGKQFSDLGDAETQDGRRSTSKSKVSGNNPFHKNPKSLLSNIQNFLDSEREENSRLRHENSALSMSVKAAKGDEQNVRKETDNLRELYSTNLIKLSTAESKINEQAKICAELQDEIYELRDSLKVAKQEGMDLRIGLQKLEAQEKALMSRKKEDQEKIVSLQQQLSEKMDEYSTLHNSHQIAEVELLRLRRALDSSEQNYENLAKDLSILKEVRSENEAKIKELSSKIQALEKENKAKLQSSHDQDEVLGTTHAQLKLVSATQEKMMKEMDKYFKDSDMEVAQNERLEELEIANKELSYKLVDVENLYNISEDKVRNLERENVRLQQLLNTRTEPKEKDIRIITPGSIVDKWMQGDLDVRSVELLENKSHQEEDLTDDSQVSCLKKELSKLKEEKVVLSSKNFSLSRKYEHLKSVNSGFLCQQYSQMAAQLNSDLGTLQDPSRQTQIVMAIELQRKNTENKYLLDCIGRFQQVISGSRLLQGEGVASRPHDGGQIKNIEQTASLFEVLVHKIVEKEASLSSREFGTESRNMNISLLQKEILLLRKKLEALDTMSDGKCSVVSTDSCRDKEKENHKNSAERNEIIRFLRQGTSPGQRKSMKGGFHEMDGPNSSKSRKTNSSISPLKEALGKRSLNEIRSESINDGMGKPTTSTEGLSKLIESKAIPIDEDDTQVPNKKKFRPIDRSLDFQANRRQRRDFLASAIEATRKDGEAIPSHRPAKRLKGGRN